MPEISLQTKPLSLREPECGHIFLTRPQQRPTFLLERPHLLLELLGRAHGLLDRPLLLLELGGLGLQRKSSRGINRKA